jgi:hypothetical protein
LCLSDAAGRHFAVRLYATAGQYESAADIQADVARRGQMSLSQLMFDKASPARPLPYPVIIPPIPCRALPLACATLRMLARRDTAQCINLKRVHAARMRTHARARGAHAHTSACAEVPTSCGELHCTPAQCWAMSCGCVPLADGPGSDGGDRRAAARAVLSPERRTRHTPCRALPGTHPVVRGTQRMAASAALQRARWLARCVQGRECDGGGGRGGGGGRKRGPLHGMSLSAPIYLSGAAQSARHAPVRTPYQRACKGTAIPVPRTREPSTLRVQCARVRAYVCLCVRTRTHTYGHTRTHTHTLTHSLTHARTHTRTHTHTRAHTRPCCRMIGNAAQSLPFLPKSGAIHRVGSTRTWLVGS